MVPSERPFTRCWTNAVTRAGEAGGRAEDRAGRLRIDRRRVLRGVVLDGDHHRGLHRVVVLVEGDDAGDAAEVLGGRDGVLDGGPGEVRRALHRVERDQGGVVAHRGEAVGRLAVGGLVLLHEVLDDRLRALVGGGGGGGGGGE